MREFLRPWVILRFYDTVMLASILGLGCWYASLTPSISVPWKAAATGLLAIAIAAVAVVAWGGGRRLMLRWMAEWFDAFRSDVSGAMIFASTLLAIAYWGALSGSTLFALLAFLPEEPLDHAAVASMIAIGVSVLPVNPPMALGTTEAAWVFALTATGKSVEVAAAIAISVRLVTIVATLVHAVCAFAIAGYRSLSQPVA